MQTNSPFTSSAQSAADTNYFDITLHMNPVWEPDSSRFWLYVEQAATANLDRPYRQRVYAVQQLEDSVFRSDIYNLPVGQGDAQVIQCPSGQLEIVDLGSNQWPKRNPEDESFWGADQISVRVS